MFPSIMENQYNLYRFELGGTEVGTIILSFSIKISDE